MPFYYLQLENLSRERFRLLILDDSIRVAIAYLYNIDLACSFIFKPPPWICNRLLSIKILVIWLTRTYPLVMRFFNLNRKVGTTKCPLRNQSFIGNTYQLFHVPLIRVKALCTKNGALLKLDKTLLKYVTWKKELKSWTGIHSGHINHCWVGFVHCYTKSGPPSSYQTSDRHRQGALMLELKPGHVRPNYLEEIYPRDEVFACLS